MMRCRRVGLPTSRKAISCGVLQDTCRSVGGRVAGSSAAAHCVAAGGGSQEHSASLATAPGADGAAAATATNWRSLSDAAVLPSVLHGFWRVGNKPIQKKVLAFSSPWTTAGAAAAGVASSMIVNMTSSKVSSAPSRGGFLWIRPNRGKKGDVGSKKDGPKKGGEGGGSGDDGDGDADDDSQNDEDMKDDITPKVVALVFGIFALAGSLYYIAQPGGDHVGWSTIIDKANDVTDINVYRNFCQVYLKNDEQGSYKAYMGIVDDGHTDKNVTSIQDRLEADKEVSITYKGTPYASTALEVLGVVAWVIPFIFFPSFVMILTRSIGMTAAAAASAGGGGDKGKLTKQMQFKVVWGHDAKFKDIAGMSEAKREVTEIVDFLKHPARYQRLGAKIPTGALLLGPPGTGKTLLAKAVAGEAGVAFIPVCGSDFVELYVGMGALRVRQLFELAKKQRCIIYIDEIDAIGLKREGAGHGEKQEQEHTLNELLTQLDGFGSNRGDVMILASSNVGQDSLDSALIRPGRFDRLVHVDAPVISERIEIFKVHLDKLLLTPAPTAASDSKAPATTVSDAESESVMNGASTDNATKSGGSDDVNKASEKKIIESILEEDSESKKKAAKSSDAGDEKPAKPSSVTAAATSEKVVEEDTKTHAIVTQPDTTSASSETSSSDSAAGEGSTAAAEGGEEEKKPELTKEQKQRADLITSYAERMSSLCPGFVGSDIMNVCNEGAILAAREDGTHVTINHLERSIDRVLAGIEQRSRVLSDFEKRVVSHHEAGHAVAGWFLGRADPLMKVSIVPRGGSALGYAQYLPNENMLRTASELMDSMCVTLGGRVAEKVFFDHLSTGASDDLRKVTRMAYMYVSSFNATTAYHAPGSTATRYVKPFGSHTSNRLDKAAKELVDEAYEKTVKLLTEKKQEMSTLAEHLLQHEVLTHADVVRFLGERGDRPSDKKQH